MMSRFIGSIRVGTHKELISFQKGILLTNKSLSEMFDYLKEKYNLEYILTSRLNQDVLENFFAYIRGMGGSNDHPSPLDFRYRLRWYILGKHSAAIFTENRNTAESNEECLLDILNESTNPAVDAETEEVCLTQKILSNLATTDERNYEEEPQDNEIMPVSFVEPPYLEEEGIAEECTELLQHFEMKEKVSEESLRRSRLCSI